MDSELVHEVPVPVDKVVVLVVGIVVPGMVMGGSGRGPDFLLEEEKGGVCLCSPLG